MIVYQKDGKDFLLMANNSRGVMKITDAPVRARSPPSRRRWGAQAGSRYETIASMKGIEQLDSSERHASLVLARSQGALNLDPVLLS